MIDLGANVGLFSYSAAKNVGNAGKVVSVEPNREMFKILKENMNRNKLTNVKLTLSAVTNKRGTVDLYSSESFGSHSLFKNLVRFPHKTYRVKSIRLVDILKLHKINTVDLLKMDVEGSEVLILRDFKNVANNIKKLSWKHIIIWTMSLLCSKNTATMRVVQRRDGLFMHGNNF